MLHGVPDFTGTWKALEEAAQSLAMTLHRFEVREPTAFDSTFAAMTRAQVQALLVLGEPAFGSLQRQIADLAVQRRLPSMCQSRAAVEAGCLMSYGPSGRGGGQQIATYVDKILRGATPAELPVEQVMQIRADRCAHGRQRRWFLEPHRRVLLLGHNLRSESEPNKALQSLPLSGAAERGRSCV